MPNDEILAYTGVSAWHAAGYTGSRVTCGTVEVLNPADWRGDGQVGTLIADDRETTPHSRMTASVFFTVAPEATLYRLSDSTRIVDGQYYTALHDDLMPAMRTLGIIMAFASMSGSNPSKQHMERVERFCAEDDSFLCFRAAGNDAGDDYNGWASLPDSVGIGAYDLADGVPAPMDYSSESRYVDFCAPTNIAYVCGPVHGVGGGTSAATPYLCGMAALVQDFFIAKTGSPLKRDALLRFLRDNSVDLEAEGHDSKTGYGACVLPDPDTVDVWAYQDGGDRMRVDDFVDAAQVSSWARGGVQTCLDLGIMDGVGGGRFDPRGVVTREQLATVVARVLEKVEAANGG